MEFRLSVKNVIIILVIAVVGYYGYTKFFGDIETTDVPRLVDVHRSASPLKQQTIKDRIVKLYKHDQHYNHFITLLDDASPVTQALAVEVLTLRLEKTAEPNLLAMLNDKSRDPGVKEQLIKAFWADRRSEAAIKVVPRLIELTAAAESHNVRVTAHDTLKEILHAGVTKFGPDMREQWEQFWRDHPRNPRR